MGLLRLIRTNRLYRAVSRGYESRFDARMMECLRPGMTIYDIGANIGHYTGKFAHAVGASGSVHAFEPVPAAADQVRRLISAYPWVHVHQCAVADTVGEVLMETAAHSTSPTNRVSADPITTTKGLRVPVTTLDEAAHKFGCPDAIKIDAEGYEWYVVKGGSDTLASPRLKHVFIEIHFALLESLSLPTAATDMEDLLKHSGFRVKYTDASHICASRL